MLASGTRYRLIPPASVRYRIMLRLQLCTVNL